MKIQRRPLVLLVSIALLPCVSGWLTGSPLRMNQKKVRSSSLEMNFFTDLGDMLSGGKLATQETLPYGEPLASVQSEPRTLAIAERRISFTGEDFDVVDVDQGSNFCRVRGAMLHLPGKDKMRVQVGGQVVTVLDRKLVAMTPTYDIYRGDESEKIGWIEKAVVALTDTFCVHIHQEGEFRLGVLQPPPAFVLEGDFLDRRFVMKNDKGEVVAKVTKDGFIQFDAFNHYQVQVAPGMDPALVVACACTVDEEFDEEHKKRAQERER